jgi:hypothetical protein
MRPLLLTLTAGTLVVLLSGCPDMPGPGPAHWQASHSRHGQRQAPAHSSMGQSAAPGDAHRSVSEIAWFQGTIDEAFSRRGCSEGHRRTLFRF